MIMLDYASKLIIIPTQTLLILFRSTFVFVADANSIMYVLVMGTPVSRLLMNMEPREIPCQTDR